MTTHRDRATALAVIGGLEILAGLGLLTMAGLLIVALGLQRSAGAMEGVSAVSLAPAIGLYGLLGVVAIVLGAGLVKCRRWARALSLIAAWLVVAMGVAGIVTYVAIVPVLASSMAAGPDQPAPAGILVAIGVIGCLLVLVLPALVVALVLRGRDARLTCEWRDRQERWTDRCPLPVLALSMLLGFGAVALLPNAFTMPAMIAGRVVTGGAATATYLALAAVLGVTAAGLYRLRPWAWWAEIVLLAAGLANAIPFFQSGRLASLYGAMGLPADEAAFAASLVASPATQVIASASVLAVAAWLILIRKHFRKAA
jgi:hypothetical protein